MEEKYMHNQPPLSLRDGWTWTRIIAEKESSSVQMREGRTQTRNCQFLSLMRKREAEKKKKELGL
jgi:hypothetical protein